MGNDTVAERGSEINPHSFTEAKSLIALHSGTDIRLLDDDRERPVIVVLERMEGELVAYRMSVAEARYHANRIEEIANASATSAPSAPRRQS